MYAFIKGIVAGKNADSVVIENNGIGYQIAYPKPERLSIGEEVLIYTYLVVREEEFSLYGFGNQKEKELFLNLISVKGVGAKTAMLILGAARTEELYTAISLGNLTYLKGLPGIGAKTASQILLDLKGKLVQEESAPSANPLLNDATSALRAMGFKASELQAIAKDLQASNEKSVDGLVKLGLRLMQRRKGGL
ncbi:MAG: Holliday junction branch migration protein RuvA [Erysipelotrichaceae bacterium]|jgi:Holliday junction DNA helicase RuvA|nr:Holliday junction branch migration protein RuvA [Erysipelotrichaceae bacterium]